MNESTKLQCVESLLTSLAASLSAKSGIPSEEILFESILAARELLTAIRANVERIESALD